MIKNITYFLERLILHKNFSTIVFKFMKLIISSLKFSTISFEIILQKSLMIISILSKASSIQLSPSSKIFEVQRSPSSKIFKVQRLSLSKTFVSSCRISRLLLLLFWWMNRMSERHVDENVSFLSFWWADIMIMIVKVFDRHLPTSEFFRETSADCLRNYPRITSRWKERCVFSI